MRVFFLASMGRAKWKLGLFPLRTKSCGGGGAGLPARLNRKLLQKLKKPLAFLKT
jgi:hypothetical protein